MIDPDQIRKKSIELGFSACGFAKAEPLHMPESFQPWLANSSHGEMKYLERNLDLRQDPTSLFPGAKTVICLMASYYNKGYKPTNPLKISRYVAGRDYHKVLKKRGQDLINWMMDNVPDLNARIYVDSAPIVEKEWGRRSGLGWRGKNTLLIRPREGSWFFLAVILTDLEIKPDKPEKRDLCGKCTLCIDACPTNALTGTGELIAKKCLSYLTVELKGGIPTEFTSQINNWLFGCDVCQEVCPHNAFAKESTIDDFIPRDSIKDIRPETILEMDQLEFDKRFSGTEVKRAGLDKLKNTISLLYPNV